jgi:hypothetical protein
MNVPEKCPKCCGRMEEGFVLDQMRAIMVELGDRSVAVCKAESKNLT